MAKTYKKYIVKEADANLDNFKYLRQTIKEIDFNKGNSVPAIREIANKVAKYEQMGKGISKLSPVDKSALNSVRNALKQEIRDQFNNVMGLGDGMQSEEGRNIAPINYKYGSYYYRTSIKQRVADVSEYSGVVEDLQDWKEKVATDSVFYNMVRNRLNDVNYFSDYITIHSTMYKRLLLVIRDAALLPANIDPEYALDLLDEAGFVPKM